MVMRNKNALGFCCVMVIYNHQWLTKVNHDYQAPLEFTKAYSSKQYWTIMIRLWVKGSIS